MNHSSHSKLNPYCLSNAAYLFKERGDSFFYADKVVSRQFWLYDRRLTLLLDQKIESVKATIIHMRSAM
jgi:hypothetical protein